MKKLTLKMVSENINDLNATLLRGGIVQKIIDIHFYGNGKYCEVLTLTSHIVRSYKYFSSDIDEDNYVSYRKCKILN